MIKSFIPEGTKRKSASYNNLAALVPPLEDFSDDLFNAHRRGIEQSGIVGRLERSGSALTIPPISRFKIRSQHIEVSLLAALKELAVATLSAHTRGSRHEDLKRRFGENDRPHVPTIGHKSGSSSGAART